MGNNKKAIKKNINTKDAQQIWHLDFRNNHNLFIKLYSDIIDWFWQNSTHVNGRKISEKNKASLHKKDKYGWLPIQSFSNQTDTEYIDNDADPVLYLSISRAKKLIQWLKSKKYPDNSIYRIQDCPGFFKNKKEPLYVYFPNRWISLPKNIREEIKNYFKQNGYCFYDKIGKNRYQTHSHNTYYELTELCGPVKLYNS